MSKSSVSPMPVCFWQNMPSHHQLPALKEFAEIWPSPIHAIWCAEISQARRQLGWRRSDLGKVEDITLPSSHYESAVDQITSENIDSIHVFSGMQAYAPIDAAFQSARRKGAKRLALMVESGIRWGLKGRLRPLRARWTARNFIPHVKLVLAMGREGVEFYRNAGFAAELVYPYIYQPPIDSPAAGQSGDTIRLIYIGKFTLRKGVDVMLRGLARTASRNWRITIVGDDALRKRYRRMALRLGLQEQVDWMGAVCSDKMPAVLAQHDLCLVPSRFEGWGVVTNEALCAGVPVLCSDRVASRELVEYSGAGAIFGSGDPSSLAKELDGFLASPSGIEQAKQRALVYRDRLHPRRIAQYLAAVLQHRFCAAGERPTPPWVTS